MGLLQRLTTEKLEESIVRNIAKIKDIVEIKDTIYYKKNIPNAENGTYIYADDIGYHFVYCESGNEESHKITDDLFEINYWLLSALTSAASFDFELKHRDENVEFRVAAFNKKLEYLGMIGENYRKRGEIEIDEILKAYPL